VNGCDIRVIQRSKDLGFTLESGDAVSVPGEFIRQNFDRHIPPELLILRMIDFAHTAFAEFVDDLIMAERFSDHEENSFMSNSRFNAMKAFQK